MIQRLKKIVLFLTMVIPFACSTTPEIEPETKEEANPVVPTKPQPSLQINDEALNAIYPHYLKLTEALVEARSGDAKISASNIERGAEEVKAGASLQRYARQMLVASSLEGQRMAYSKLSNEFIAMVKKAGVKNGALYTAFCPMANNNEGANWLSWSKEIRNPYFGKEMLSCGSVEETIGEETTKGKL